MAYFPFLIPSGRLLHAGRDKKTKSRFLYFPRLYFCIATAAAVIPAVIFPKFARFILFLYLVTAAVLL
ncbi:MAG TPA: hypothetical protein DDY61_02600, partial [Ruminococcaceae bacterium]|nr:hypothetical protein [Oscillospiraceae bacterium]